MAGRGRDSLRPAWMVQAERDGQLDGTVTGSTLLSPAAARPPPTYEPFPPRLPTQPAQPLPQYPPPPSGPGHQKRQYYRDVERDMRPRSRSPPSDARRYPPPLPPPVLPVVSYPPPLPIMAPQITPYGTPPVAINAFPGTVRARKVYVSGIEQTPAAELQDFLTHVLAEATFHRISNPVISLNANNDKNFAFAELATMELAMCLIDAKALTFTSASQNKTFTLLMNFPKDHDANLLNQYQEPKYGPIIPRHFLSQGDGEYKIYVANLPNWATEDDLRAIVEAYGPTKYIKIIKNDKGESKGFAFFEYVESAITKEAIEQLNDTELGDIKLLVQLASSTKAKEAAAAGGGGAGGVVLTQKMGMDFASALQGVLLSETAGQHNATAPSQPAPPPPLQQQQQPPPYYAPTSQQPPPPPYMMGGGGYQPAPPPMYKSYPPPTGAGYPVPMHPPHPMLPDPTPHHVFVEPVRLMKQPQPTLPPTVPAPIKPVDSLVPTPPLSSIARPGTQPPPPKIPNEPIGPPTRVLSLLNVVEERDLMKQFERNYFETLSDVEGEAKNYGRVLKVVIPKDPKLGLRVFVQYDLLKDAVEAAKVFHKREFAGRTVEVRWYNEAAFVKGDYVRGDPIQLKWEEEVRQAKAKEKLREKEEKEMRERAEREAAAVNGGGG